MKANVLEKITSAALQFLVPQEPQETFSTIVSEAMKISGADYGTVVIKDNGQFQRVYTTADLPLRVITKTNNTAAAFTKNQVIVIDRRALKKNNAKLQTYGIRSTIYIPLAYKEKTIGVLILHAKKTIADSAEQARVLKLFGTLASMAIHKTELYDQTKKALEMRDFFISLAAHELRTPLTAIHGYIQLLQKRLDKKEMNVEQEWVQEMYAESIKLTSLINELLEINRIERKKEQFFFAECELLAIINFAVERAAIMHPQHTFIVKKNMHSSDMIIADIDKIRQVMTSLLDNAAKFSPLGSEIIIKIQSVKNSFTITIIDKGEGITSEDLAHVFEGFYKGKNNHKTGMGVGLLLAKHTLEAHHGSIAVTSEIGKGTTVTLTIPRSRIGVTPS